MTFATREWVAKLLASVELPAPEVVHRLERIEAVERRFVLPIKVAALLMLIHSFRTSPWFGLPSGTLDVAVETMQAISVTYGAANVLVAGVLLLSRRVPFVLVQWSVFAICLVDAVFLAGVTVLTGGYESVLYWLFLGLIVRNAASIPPAWSQLVLNLNVCLCYLVAGSLDIAVRESEPEMFSELPRYALLSESEIRDAPLLAGKLRHSSDPLSQSLWRQFSPGAQQVLSDTNTAPDKLQALLVDQLNVVLRGNSLYEDQRFAGVVMRPRTRLMLDQNPRFDRLVLLNRLLLEDAYPKEIAKSQAPRQIVSQEPALETPAEPLLFRVFVLLLMAACCYGIQVLLEKQRLATEEAHESGLREGQLRLAGRLAAEIAHQIKNPLAIINNAAFSVERAVEMGKASPQKQLEIIKEEVGRADRIITQLMGYAQLCEGHVERLNVTEELDRAVARVLPAGAGFTANLHRDYAPHLPPLLMHRNHLSEILDNLLQNAREATSGSGNISVSAKAYKDNSVELGIRDDGPGIPAERKERIFEAYYTTKPKGTGLGLAIVKHNVELYGGAVRVESELGKGARFIIVFPTKTHV